jgi:hypothetical protein
MATCITQDLKTMLINLLEKKKPHEFISMVVDEIFPTCESLGLGLPTKEAVAAKRKIAGRWPNAIYVDAKGKTIDKGLSASALYEELMGKKPSGTVCDEEGTKCTAISLIDSFRLNGYFVQGDGEDAPETDTENPGATLKAHEAWKDHLNTTGKKFIVINPKSPTIKKIQE